MSAIRVIFTNVADQSETERNLNHIPRIGEHVSFAFKPEFETWKVVDVQHIYDTAPAEYVVVRLQQDNPVVGQYDPV